MLRSSVWSTLATKENDVDCDAGSNPPCCVMKQESSRLNGASVRVWVDGSFDLLHIGHVFAMHQARKLGDVLVVGAQSDADVIKHKGPPVIPEEERFRLISAVKFVDEFVGVASYGTSVETLDKHGCAFCVHGDDAPLRASEADPISILIRQNRAKLVSRGHGLSTTKLIDRVLQRHESLQDQTDSHQGDNAGDIKEQVKRKPVNSLGYATSALMISALLDKRVPEPNQRIVYVDGAFDLFHIGHLSFLEQAASEGDFLIVGVHSDSAVERRKGPMYPVLSVMNRALMVLSLKCVGDVIFEAPNIIDDDFLETFKIDLVFCSRERAEQCLGDMNPYEIPKTRGILKVFDKKYPVTTQTIVDRIVSRRDEYVARNKRKFEQEVRAAGKLKSLE